MTKIDTPIFLSYDCMMDIIPTTESESALGQLKALLFEVDEDMELKKFKRFGNTDEIFDEVQRIVRERQDQQ